ncbi:MAG: sigma-54-dependent Fis family transcriptional regulator [Planctomycetales bacterium]|nr:sigma-54-dependent Fis family transcriptional regulator [Planctomycetales bacterium]
MARWLVIDDEESIGWGLQQLGSRMGHTVRLASSAEEGLQVRDGAKDGAFCPDIILLDVRLPGMDGLTAFSHLKAQYGNVPIVIMTAYGDLETAVGAVRQGAFEYIVKPFDMQQIRGVVERALSQTPDIASDSHEAPRLVEGMVGDSVVMQQVYRQIALAANSDACVLLQGESGTGKELAAQAIHRYSRRAGGPFVAVSLAALSDTLVESELFGHVKGSFTGAEQTRQGLLAQANGGTLFLDEVGEIPLATQVKLLRALESHEFTPVGSNRIEQSDFRVISATHQDLLHNVEEKRFRHDLYFRLCAYRIDLPPLRMRPEDIPLLTRHFLELLTSTGQRAVLAPETLDELRRRPWYGNVRELRNVMEHALISARGTAITPEDLPPAVNATFVSRAHDAAEIGSELVRLLNRWAESMLTDTRHHGQIYDDLLQLVEPPVLLKVLHTHREQVAVAARALGIHRTTLAKKLQKYGWRGEELDPIGDG